MPSEEPYRYQIWLTVENRLAMLTSVDEFGRFACGFYFATRSCQKINDREFRRDELKRRATAEERSRFLHALHRWNQTDEEVASLKPEQRRRGR